MKIVKKISIIFLCVVLLLISTSCFLEDWQWQRLYQEEHIAWCSNDENYEYRKVKIEEILRDYEKREWYRRYCFKVIEYDDEQKEYIDIGVKRFNCSIYLFESAQNLKERGLNNSNIQIFEKPLRYKEIAAFINKEVLQTSI